MLPGWRWGLWASVQGGWGVADGRLGTVGAPSLGGACALEFGPQAHGISPMKVQSGPGQPSPQPPCLPLSSFPPQAEPTHPDPAAQTAERGSSEGLGALCSPARVSSQHCRPGSHNLLPRGASIQSSPERRAGVGPLRSATPPSWTV